MRINTNISALRASNSLNKSNNALTKSLERLSSGYRINRAADDAAGLAISQKMKTQIAGLEQADRNSADGISLIQTAEGALVEVQSMVQRMRELSVQAANGTNTQQDRESIQAEIDQLTEEIERISKTTEFNTLSLLDGSCDRKAFSTNTTVKLLSTSDTVAAGNYEVQVIRDARQAVLSGASLSGFDAGVDAAHAGKLNINGVEIEIREGDTKEQVFQKIREGCSRADINVIAAEPADPTDPDSTPKPQYTHPDANESNGYYVESGLTATSQLVFISKEFGASQTISINCDNPALAAKLGIAPSVTASGYDVEAKVVCTGGSNFNKTATVSTSGQTITVTDRNGFEMVMEAGRIGSTFNDMKVDGTRLAAGDGRPSAIDADDGTVAMKVLSAGSLKLQVGANEGQTIEIAIQRVDPETLGIDALNVTSVDKAQKAITICDDAIQMVSKVRSKLGAYQNRLEHTVNNLGVASENMTEALSRIADTDMAAEMAQYTNKNVLVQAGTSMLAQANQRPQQILSLLNA